MPETSQQNRPKIAVNVVIKPTRLFLISIVAGLILQLLWPFNFASSIVTVLLGLSLVSGSLGLIALLPTWLILRWGVIAREEQYLAERSGATYLDYKTAVRRWL